MKDVEQFPQVCCRCPYAARVIINVMCFNNRRDKAAINVMCCKNKRDEAAMQVMNVAFIITALLCTVIGGCGYYMFGSVARDVVTFNLPAVRLLAASLALPCLLMF